MYKNLFNLLTILLILPSCTDMSPNISVVCEENNIGNCILKWETTPLIKGQVKVYTSDNPEFIPEDNPVAMANISDARMTIVTNDPSRRSYYMLSGGGFVTSQVTEVLNAGHIHVGASSTVRHR